MFNLLSAEFYKWKKSKSFKVSCIVAVAVIMFIYFSFEMAEQIQNGQIENGTGGVTVTGDVTQIQILDVVSEVTSGGTNHMFIGVFICIWVVSEFSHGAIKNVAGKGYSRKKVFLSKYISSIISASVMNILILGTMAIVGAVTLGTEGIDVNFFKDFFSYVGMQTMFNIALTSIFVMICEFIRNTAFGISANLGIITFSTLITGGLNLLFQRFDLDIKASTYWVLDLVAECPMGAMDMDFIGRAISVTVMWTALSLVIGMVHFEKADIK